MTPAILFKFTLAALLAIWPAAVDSKFYPGPKVDRPATPITQDAPDADVMAYCYGNPPGERRVCRIAREVSTVVHEHAVEGRIPFVGPAAEQATALALLEIAWHESGFRSKVETCVINGIRHARARRHRIALASVGGEIRATAEPAPTFQK